MDVTQQLNLRWNNHSNNVLQVFLDHFSNENMVDVTLTCQGKFLKAHKMILSACSPYFQELFEQHQMQHPIIIMNGMKFSDIKLVVDFMYKGEVKVYENELEGLLAVSEALKVKGLSNVRNKYEKGDIQGNELDQQEVVSQGKMTVPEIETGKGDSPKAKKRKISNDLFALQKNLETSFPIEEDPLGNNNKIKKNLADQSNNKEETDVPSMIKVEPPDIHDRERNNSERTQKLIVNLVENSQISQNFEASQKSDNESLESSYKEFKEAGGKRFLVEFAQDAVPTEDVESTSEHTQLITKRAWKIPRPPNAFMIFANEWRKKLACQHPNDSNKAISVRLGLMWKALSPETKEVYYASSRLADEEHKRKYPGYYYSPKEARMRKNSNLSKKSISNRGLEGMDSLVKVLLNTDENCQPLYLVKDPNSPDQFTLVGRTQDFSEEHGFHISSGFENFDKENNGENDKKKCEASPKPSPEDVSTKTSTSNDE